MTSLSNRGRARSYAPIKHSAKCRNLYLDVRKTAVLTAAWRQVRTNGLSSSSRETRDEIRLFDRDSHREIRGIQARLRRGWFVFDKQFGVLQTRFGKKPRPLVIATVKNRIVQRAILDVLQATSEIEAILATPTSFGGIRGRGRKHALEAAYQAIQSGAAFFLRSDIRGFFTCIPRDKVHDFISTFVNDVQFLELLRRATETELANLAQLRGNAQYFPIHELGVAQGCALSPLLGNIVLREFDRALNGRGMVRLRYIDDFLLLGPNRRSVLAAFESARRILGGLGLDAYDPSDSSGKAVVGDVRAGFEFLGCHVRPGVIQPSRGALRRFRERVQEIIDDAQRSMNSVANSQRVLNGGLVQHLFELDNVGRGWAHSHSFCNAREVLTDVDAWIDSQIDRLVIAYSSHRRGSSAMVGRRLLGVQPLRDIPCEPIIQPTRVRHSFAEVYDGRSVEGGP
jgi:RNA-directed DNA polymerase